MPGPPERHGRLFFSRLSFRRVLDRQRKIAARRVTLTSRVDSGNRAEKRITVRLCKNCHLRPIPPGHRIYCEQCSSRASAIWKARQRRQWAQDWRAHGRVGQPPWLDDWQSIEVRRTYYRDYMRRWRRRRKSDSPTESRVPLTSAAGQSRRGSPCADRDPP